MFAFNYLHLYSTWLIFENKNIYTQLQSSSSNAAKGMFKFDHIKFDF